MIGGMYAQCINGTYIQNTYAWDTAARLLTVDVIFVCGFHHISLNLFFAFDEAQKIVNNSQMVENKRT
jgi:hypothetical protein